MALVFWEDFAVVRLINHPKKMLINKILREGLVDVLCPFEIPQGVRQGIQSRN